MTMSYVRTEKPEPKTEAETLSGSKHRPCLMCRQQFESEWAGERVCKRCKATASWRQG